MKRAVHFVILVVLLAAQSFAAAVLPRSTPEAQGISSAAIRSFIEEADQKIDAMHSVMIVRHGKVVAEGWWTPYDATTRHELYSLSKSFTSTAVGMAVAEGKLSVDDEVLKFFPGEAPAEPSANLKSMRVSDLLRMNAGHQVEIPTAKDLMTTKLFLSHPVPFKPGTRFLYNTPATFMLSAIVQKVSGQTVAEYLKPRLFDPLGIVDPIWETNIQGISLGGYGLNVRTEDIAKFGQLYLQKGRWNGQQLLPASWVEAASARQTSNGSNPKSDWDQGYGYQFWRSRNGAYRGDGAFGQYCIVMPEQDTVIAITSGVKDMQAVLNLVWDKLLPAMQPKKLPADKSAQQQLATTLSHLSLRTATGAATPPMAAKVAGKKFVFPANEQKLESLALQSSTTGGTTLLVRINGKDQRIDCGSGEWKKGRLAYGTFPERAVAVSGAWSADDTYTSKICFNETPYMLTVKLHFADGQLTYESEYNVFFGNAKPPQLVGKVE